MLRNLAIAQQPARPPFATTKVEGIDNVYIFRNGGHQAMFIVTDEGVMATDPVAYGRPVESEKSNEDAIAMDWDRMIPGHPGPGDRLGTKKDAQDQLALLRAASTEMKKLAQDGKCWDTAEMEFKLSGYESWPGYEAGVPLIARRCCGYWGRGT